MSKKLITAAVVAAGFAVGLAPTAHADDINREVCLAVMAMGVNPYDPSDHYTLNMLQRYPDIRAPALLISRLVSWGIEG
ncbi:hypothetical protein NJB1907f44_26440 [Mycobacterium marinum]|uniref:hypothetical protein n=1 Tax=Mycobacterium marinum TaxID=1781 RepID=UPI000E3D9158|nr:hypothetical protein [Mycobacterium marinum]RFZ34110.1 hypothetical protein KST_04017 [Mycobacterium marinum]GJN95845.1 hypothetical protein NJB1907f34b_02570 [Mycobacterium marinum]GJN99301.1 hypothetical protein NJB1907E8_50680 [Mycobacterium marinum]GJO08411.1 hypothetical protein NJB1808e29_40910 [Mycobacterium marinum]GJO20235.1 hypothetical protein NJB1907E90_50620 [Mycobacterium marinum]